MNEINKINMTLDSTESTYLEMRITFTKEEIIYQGKIETNQLNSHQTPTKTTIQYPNTPTTTTSYHKDH